MSGAARKIVILRLNHMHILHSKIVFESFLVIGATISLACTRLENIFILDRRNHRPDYK